MQEIVTVVYEKGVLRPLRPLHLRERQTVRIQFLPEEPADETEAVIRRLAQEGLLTPPTGQSAVEPISQEERCALAQQLGQAAGRPLSEVIIEERGEQ